jgi:signal transduction histidine kinase
MIAAVIATYLITERMVKPLKNMTNAAKKFAKGDFTTRVYVGDTKDEVSELGTAFNNMADSLENLEKMRNSFLANISHDLRTPMTTIAGFIDGINSGAIPPEKHEYYLGVISAEVHRLSRLVSQLLDVSRLESGERKFNFTDFDIAEVARLILISFEKKIEDKKLEVEFDAEFDEMYAHADKDAIYQVLYNLCHNAIKFAKEGGVFRISISRATDTKLKISIYDQGQSISEEESLTILIFLIFASLGIIQILLTAQQYFAILSSLRPFVNIHFLFFIFTVCFYYFLSLQCSTLCDIITVLLIKGGPVWTARRISPLP